MELKPGRLLIVIALLHIPLGGMAILKTTSGIESILLMIVLTAAMIAIVSGEIIIRMIAPESEIEEEAIKKAEMIKNAKTLGEVARINLSWEHFPATDMSKILHFPLALFGNAILMTLGIKIFPIIIASPTIAFLVTLSFLIMELWILLKLIFG